MKKITLKHRCRIYMEKKREVRTVTTFWNTLVQIRIFRISQNLPFIVLEILVKRQEISTYRHFKKLQELELDPGDFFVIFWRPSVESQKFQTLSNLQKLIFSKSTKNRPKILRSKSGRAESKNITYLWSRNKITAGNQNFELLMVFFQKNTFSTILEKWSRQKLWKKITLKHRCRIYVEKKGEVRTVTTFRNM